MKGCVVFLPRTEKHIFAPSAGNPWEISPNCLCDPHCHSSLIFQVLSKLVQFWGVIAKNPSASCHNDCNKAL